MKTKFFLPIFIFLLSSVLYAQEKTVSGTILDENDMPLSGANVSVQGTERGTQADFDGNYEISVTEGEVLVFSFVGFEDKTVTVDDQDTIDVVLKEGEALDEVVVIGYGTQRRVDNTAAISSVSAEEISKTKVVNATKAIQGKVAGVNITASDEPGATPSISIRGLGTVLGGRNPLYVVDGMFTNNINNINPNDIESFDVLKDASALAIYGNRGANGVIIITTKSGKGKLKVEYDGNIGIRNPLRKVNMASSNEFAKYSNVALGENVFSENQPYNTNWFDEITRTVIYHQHDLNISGASDNIKYLFSVNNFKEKGLLKGSDFNRTTIRTNNEFKIAEGIKLAQNMSMAFNNNTPKPLGAFTTAYKQSPLVPVRYEDGRYGVPIINSDGLPDPSGNNSFNNVGNPLAQLELDNQKNKSFLLQGGLKLDIELGFLIDGLRFTSQFNSEYNNAEHYSFDNGQRLIGEPPANFENRITNSKTDYFDWLLSNYLSYNKIFGNDHSIEATLGMESSHESGLNTFRAVREDVDPNKNYWNLGGTNYSDNVTDLEISNLNDQRTISYFGRFQYKLLDRYLITGTLRRDGSSQFSKGNKWGLFPSFGLGWVLSKENFLVDSDLIDLLKLRGGWGRLGNQNIPLNVPTFASGSSYRYSFDGEKNWDGITVDQVLDPNLGWEITEELSGGIDFGLLDNKLTGSIDLYDKTTKNIVLASIPVSSSGISKAGYTHMGEVSNKGIEVVLGWQNSVGEDFTYSVSANYSYNRNKLENIEGNINPIHGGSLANGQWTKNFDNETVGFPLGSFYLWEVEGFDDEGNFLYKDVNENGATGASDSNDRQFLGSYIPKSTLGINFNFNYKNWDLSVDTYGAFGAKVYNGKKAQRFAGENIEQDIATDFWTTSNTSAANPAPFNSVPLASSYYLESGDYFRINNVTLGYNLIEPFNFMESMRFYISAIHPFVTQKFSGYSSELNADRDPYGLSGIELNAYPTLRSFLFGMNLKF